MFKIGDRVAFENLRKIDFGTVVAVHLGGLTSYTVAWDDGLEDGDFLYQEWELIPEGEVK